MNPVEAPHSKRYENPVAFWDCSDPDAIRIGDAWYMVASSFCNVPGLPIYRSENLVDWELVSYALKRLQPDEHYRKPRPGCGVWAPAIRWSGDEVSVWYPDPDFGIFKVSAKAIEGPWSEPMLVEECLGSIDPCPFVDDDGSRWLVKAWAKSRVGFNNRLTLLELDENDRAVDAGVTIIDGFTLPPARTSSGEKTWITIEGPKLYKRNGRYYIFAPAGGVKHGWQGVFRAQKLEGPWESRVVMDQGTTAVNGPHQGAWIDAPDGSNWFLHFQDRGAWGRVVHLQPLSWIDDWPLIGADSGDGVIGEPVAAYRLPVNAPRRAQEKAGTELNNDTKSRLRIVSQWQWSANPRPGWIRSERDRFTLACIPGPPNPWEVGAAYSVKIAGPEFALQARLSFMPAAGGERAGLVILGAYCRWVGLRYDEGALSLVVEDFPDAETARTESVRKVLVPKAASLVHLRSSVFDSRDASGTAVTIVRTEWSADGEDWIKAGEDFAARPGRWVGTRAGFMASAPYGTAASTENRNGEALIDLISIHPDRAEASLHS